ncbi:hypothetical protein BAY61_19810 [Prauserella marina]|uniref:DUF6226 family protein n=1 Tax=Prauserella marina TaxID=530584 RepID=UPI000B8D70D0|nr:DUF6226 family protein [Prauserella marina]ASR39476.1 hypothetical protein BAY61_19810 [Prauserella marina]
MTTPTALDALVARVSANYDRLGLPEWPDPHPDGAMPRDEEYSRVTGPGKYRALHARARVWTELLREVAGAEAAELSGAELGAKGDPRRFDRGVRLTSPRQGTLPLMLLERDQRGTDSDPLVASLYAGVGPMETGEDLPDCGCDACDSGSADLLAALDATIGEIVGGPSALVRGDGWYSWWSPGGARFSSVRRRPSGDTMMALAKRLARGEDVRLPSGAEAFTGRSWLG